MNPLEAFVLGMVQGITEWLPVSSSGHLVILQVTMGIEAPILYDILLHVATALIVLVVLRAEAIEIFKSISRSIRRKRAGERFATILKEEDGTQLAWLIVIGSVPTAIIGFYLHLTIEPIFTSLPAVGVALILTGVILAMTFKFQAGGKRRFGFIDGLIIGIVQGIAFIPGISRSGTTISAGLFLRGERMRVVRYSFLLAVPAIIGAASASVLNINWASTSIDPINLVIGLVSAGMFAFLGLKMLLLITARMRLHLFAPYCIILGIVLISMTIS